MKNYLLNFTTAFLLFISINLDAQTTDQDIRIPNWEFRKYCLEKFDTDKDGIISKEEAAEVKSIYVYKDNISTVRGIEFFPNLQILSVSSPSIKEIDVSKNILLEELSISRTKISKLDISSNKKLISLNCNASALTEVDLSNNSALEKIYISELNLTKVDISNLPNLTILECDKNNLSELDVTNNIKLDKLDCDKNNLTHLDVSKNTELSFLNISDNKISSIDLSQNKQLGGLYCNNNQISILNLTSQKFLYTLSCSNNKLTTLDLKDKKELTYLNCSNNRLKTLNLDTKNGLEDILCANNNLTTLILPALPNNPEMQIDYGNNPNLKNIKNLPKKYTKEEVYTILKNNLKNYPVNKMHTLVPYKKDMKWGLMDKDTKQPVGKAIYQNIDFFSPKSWGKFNSSFEFTLFIENDELRINVIELPTNIEIGVASYDRSESKAVSSADGYKGFEVNYKGKIVKYSDLYQAQETDEFNIKPFFYKGKYYAIASLKGTNFKEVLIDTQGDYVPGFDQIYEDIDFMKFASNDQEKWFYVKETSGKAYFQNMEGKRKMENQIFARPSDYNNFGYAILSDKTRSGVLDLITLEWVSPPQTELKYNNLRYSSETKVDKYKTDDRDKVNLYILVTDKNNIEYYIDLKGTKYLPVYPKKKKATKK